MKIKMSIVLATALAIGFAGCGDDYAWDHNNVSKLDGQYTLEKIAEYDNNESIGWYNAQTRGIIAKTKIEQFLISEKLAAGISVSIKYYDNNTSIYETNNSNGANEENAISKYTTEYNYAFGCAKLDTTNPAIQLGIIPVTLIEEVGETCREKLTPTHRFKVGSLTKTTVGRTILDMDDDNVNYPNFSINDPITKHLPTSITSLGNLSGITVHQLLHHTSGLGDIDATKTGTAAEKIAEALSKTRVTEPGRMYKYNNAGYILLGQIIEYLAKDNNSSATWQSEVKARLNEAVGINTFVFPNTVGLDGNYSAWLDANLTKDDNTSLAKGYGTSFTDDVTASSAADIAHSAGSLIGSVPDVTKWMESIATNNNVIDGNMTGLLSDEYFQKNLNTINTSTYADIYLGNTQWNLGAGIGYDQNQNSLFHLGNFSGYACHSVYSKNERVTITVCVNGNADLAKLPYDLLEAMYPYRTKFLPAAAATTH
jgi:CubicO group peptidase (beta-lactamase class C family)